MGLACQRASGAVGAGASVTGRWAALSGRHMRQGAGGWAGRVSEGKAGSGDARERLETAREMGRSVRRSGGRRAGEASGALGRLRDGCGDRSEFGPVARDEGERGRSGPRWVTGPRGAGQAGESGPSERKEGVDWALREGRAGWAQGRETGQAKGENWAGVLGKGLESWVLLWVPLFYFDSKTNTQVGIQMRI